MFFFVFSSNGVVRTTKPKPKLKLERLGKVMFSDSEINELYWSELTRKGKAGAKVSGKPSKPWKGLPKPKDMPTVLDMVDNGMLDRMGHCVEKLARQQKLERERLVAARRRMLEALQVSNMEVK